MDWEGGECSGELKRTWDVFEGGVECEAVEGGGGGGFCGCEWCAG